MDVKHESSDRFGETQPTNGLDQPTLRKPAPEGGRHVQSVSRALQIVEAIAVERDGLTLSELAERVGLNSSTCHHLVGTLVAHGFIVHLGRSRGYALGQKMHELVALSDGESDPAVLLKNDVVSLGERIGHSVQLAVLSETSLLTKLRYVPPVATATESDELTKMTAMHATATGKAILAWLPEIALVRVISANGMTRYTDRTITSLSGLVEELRMVRRRGYSIDDEELKEGVVCIGAALRDPGGAVVASISATGAAEDMTEPYRTELAGTMVAAAMEFSKRLHGGKR